MIKLRSYAPDLSRGGSAPSVSEASLHRAVAEFLGWTLHPPVFWTTFPAGGGGVGRGAKLKAMGLKAGVPDLLIFFGGKAIGIELKQPRKYLEPHQREVHAAMKAAGVTCYTAKSVADVNLILRVAGVLSVSQVAA